MNGVRLLMVGILVGFAATAGARDCDDYAGAIDVLWTQGAAGGVLALCAAPGVVYTVNNDALRVLSVADDAPSVLSSLTLSGNGMAVALVGTRAAVADYNSVDVIDVSTPSAPVLLDSEPGSALDLAVVGDLLYVAAGANGLHILRLETDGSLSSLALMPTPGSNCTQVAADGARVLLREGGDLRIVDASDPGAPSIVGGVTYSYPNVLKDVALAGDVALVLVNPGVRALDITQPAAPVELAALELPELGARLDRDGALGYVAYNGGYERLDLSDPAAPSLDYYLTVVGAVTGVVASGPRAYVGSTSGSQALSCIDLAGATPPNWLDQVDLLFAGPADVDAHAGIAVAANPGHPAVLFDVSDPRNVRELPEIGITIEAVAVGDGHVYIDQTLLRTFDVSDPENPVVTSVLGHAGYTTSMALDRAAQRLVIGTTASMVVLSVVLPATPQPLSTVEDLDVVDVLINGNLVYLLTSGCELKVFDISAPETPVELWTVPAYCGERMALGTGTLYIADGAAGIRAFHLTGQGYPDYKATFGDVTATDLAVHGAHAYVSCPEGIEVYDVSNPLAGISLGRVRDGDMRSVALLDDEGLVAVGVNLFATAALDCGDLTAVEAPPAPVAPLTAQPNPFNPSTTLRFALPAAGAVDVAVYDLAGRRLRRLATGWREAGEQRVVWDGRDDSGHALPSGVYFAQVGGAGLDATSKLVLLK